MSLEFNTYLVNDSYDVGSFVRDSSGINWACEGQFVLTNGFKWESTNAISTAAVGQGDGCMTEGAIRTDGDLVISAGWADGFGIRRVQNDGSISLLYEDATPHAYASWTSCAVDTVNHQAYIGTYGATGIVQYDYRDLVTGGSTVDSSVWHIADGLPSDQVGYAYNNGLSIVGDYLYFGNYITAANQHRWNHITKTVSNIDVSNFYQNGYRGSMYYDVSNNRMWNFNVFNGQFYAIDNPELEDTYAVCTRVLVTGMYAQNDAYGGGVLVSGTDKNVCIIKGNYGMNAEMDFSATINGTGTTPTVTNRSTNWPRSNQYHGGPYKMNHNNALRPHPIYGNEMGILTPSVGWWSTWGWYDKENFQMVGIGYYGETYCKPGGGHNYALYSGLRCDYGGIPVVVTTDDASQYLVFSGYGGASGYAFRTWDLDMFDLHDSAYIIWGDFTLSSGKNIGSIKMQDLKDMVYIPVDTTFTCEASNDGGTTWESYDYVNEENHLFSSTGSTGRIRITLTGTGKKCSYMLGKSFPTVTVYGVTGLFTKTYENVSSKKIKGI